MRTLILRGLVSLALSSSAATAQPEDFIDLGRRVVQETLVVPIHLDFAGDVQWLRIELPTVTPTSGFVDMWTRVETWTPTDLLFPYFTWYDNAGLHLGGRVDAGSFNQVNSSFGQPSPRRPPNILEGDTVDCHWPFQGQHGSLDAGVYWIPVTNGLTGYSDGWIVRNSNADPRLQEQRNTTLCIRVHPPEIPFCDPDLNWDGNADQDDVAFLVDAISHPEWQPCVADADYNRDGTADMDDVRALIDVIASGECP
ncbi:MAG: hypothetical protein WAZ94_06735 [Phycisphaerales bacterium]